MHLMDDYFLAFIHTRLTQLGWLKRKGSAANKSSMKQLSHKQHPIVFVLRSQWVHICQSLLGR